MFKQAKKKQTIAMQYENVNPLSKLKKNLNPKLIFFVGGKILWYARSTQNYIAERNHFNKISVILNNFKVAKNGIIH